MRHLTVRIASFGLLAALALTAMRAPVAIAEGGSTACLVRNVTQDTQGGSFKAMVADADDGDRLRVRGSCTSAGVVVRADLTISGVDDDAILHGRDRGRVLRSPDDCVGTSAC